MADPSSFDAWWPSACEGTPACPPRCPRYVDETGTALLVEPRDPPVGAGTEGLAPPEADRFDPDDIVLVATCGDAVRGYAWLESGDDGTRTGRVRVAREHENGGLPVELARQAIAYAIADGAGRLVVEGDAAPFVAAGPDLVETPAETLEVPLRDPEATALTTPPGRTEGDHTGVAAHDPVSPAPQAPAEPGRGEEHSHPEAGSARVDRTPHEAGAGDAAAEHPEAKAAHQPEGDLRKRSEGEAPQGAVDEAPQWPEGEAPQWAEDEAPQRPEGEAPQWPEDEAAGKREKGRADQAEDRTVEPLAERPTGAAVTGQGTTAEVPDLSGLFGPRVVAVVGATDREGSIGRFLVENLEGYGGEVVPVTTRSEAVLGRPAASSLAAVPAVADVSGVDLAIIAVPPEAAVEAVEAAVEEGVENAVVVSAGFEEAGGEDHARRLRALAEASDLTLVGPNSMGVMSSATGLNATFGPRDPPRGSVSLISQSGAFVTAAVAAAVARGLGYRHVVSVGNKAGVDEVDLLRYYDADPGTDVIAAYLEDVVDGEAFVEVAREVTRSTPVVVLKAGRTDAGAAAAASHTGSLASDDTAVEAAFDRAGVLRADSAEELMDFVAALGSPLPAGDAVGVVTNAGGPGVLTTDAVSAEGLDLATFESGTRDALGDLLPPTASAGNPVDVLGDADVDRFTAAVDAVLADPGVDVGITVTTPHPLVDHADLVAAVGRSALARNTTVVTCLMDGDLDADAKRALRRYGVPNYPDPTRAAGAVAARWRYAQYRDRPPVAPPVLDLDLDRIEAILERASAADRDRLGVESLGLLEACGLTVPDWRLADSPEAVGDLAREIGGESGGESGDGVVLKVASPDVIHKADVGAVRVGVAPSAAADVAATMLEAVREANPAADIDGVVVQEAVDAPDGVETVVGATDSPFGHLVAFGLGGLLVEETADVAFELAPLDARVASDMLDATAVGSVLEGVRGSAPADRDALVDALLRIAALVEAVPAIAELDVNPLVATPDGAVAVDLAVELAGQD
ncbi:MAG: acetate--CoA ligase family protein [Haloarculaceae archaeon]